MDSGNLVLRGDQLGMNLRQSFENPTDTFLLQFVVLIIMIIKRRIRKRVFVVLLSLYARILCLSQPCLAGDTMKVGENLTDSESTNLVSVGGYFELGFFSPPGSSNRHLGIWYHELEPQSVVWVANRDRPVVDSTGVFQLSEDGNLMVLDTNGTKYWSSGLQVSSFTNRTVKLMDSGNLMLRDDQYEMSLWQSFEHPTDTFLAGMKMDKDLVLTSWRGPGDPGSGNFTFEVGKTGNNLYRIYRKPHQVYWESGILSDFSSETIPPMIYYLLTNFTPTSSIHKIYGTNFSAVPPSLDYRYRRLVMNSTGEIQFLSWDNLTKGWLKQWEEPENKCEIYNFCGNWSSCNINNRMVCKCLPGFIPRSPAKQDSGEVSEGCFRKSTSCWEGTKFIELKMMKVKKPGKQVNAADETECRSQCQCPQCQAYSYNASTTDYRRSFTCLIWTDDLPTLQEDYPNVGLDLYVRVSTPDIASTARTCDTCGTNTIPYPLSTERNCGDPSYFKFNCNFSTGQVSFMMAGDSYRVTGIEPDARKFFIQVKDSSPCDDSYQGRQLDRPFNVTNWCRGADEVEISWSPPPEPDCSESEDCKDWSHSTCNATGKGIGRCLCDKNYQWNGLNLNCSPAAYILPRSIERSRRNNSKSSLPLIVGVTFSSMIFLASMITFAYFWRRKIAHREERGKVQRIRERWNDSERYLKDLIDLEELEEKGNEGIEVPYFDFETILAVTDNFSDANKLGRGGYGPVYKGRLPGGQDIAVKRLSSVSSQGLKEFKNEVVLIAKLQHRNLVRLRGYCIKGDEKILLYEYMPNKSLDLFIFDSTQSVFLDWQMRFDIILGVARGMLYLHQDSRLRVVHRDLKTSNILLDEEMQPKISDFGLARIFGGKETEANTERVVGTYGYMSPEYALDGFFSIKSDVFSFGVVVLEIISGKKNTGFFQSGRVSSVLGYAWRLWAENKLLDLMDQSLSETCNASQFIRCAEVSLLCVQDEPGDRPTMSNVVIMLESESASLPTPKQPTFFMNRRLSSTASSSSKPETILQTTSSYQEGR